MARGRFVSKVISLDEKVNALSDDTARLLFTWLITHLDCEGRMHGDSVTVKSIVFPRRKISTQKIEKYLKELEKNDLIFRYSINGSQYLLMKNFEKHQPGLNKNRESQSQIPPFTPELIRSNAGKSPTEVKVKEKDKVNISVESIINAYQDNILEGSLINEEMDKEIRGACRKYGTQAVIDAMTQCIKEGQPRWRNMMAYLELWAKEGTLPGKPQ